MRVRPPDRWAKFVLLLLLVVLLMVGAGGVRPGPGDTDAIGASFTP